MLLQNESSEQSVLLPQHDTVHPDDKTTADIRKSMRIITALPEIADEST